MDFTVIQTVPLHLPKHSPAIWMMKKLDLKTFLPMTVSHWTNKESLIKCVGTCTPFLLSQKVLFPSGWMREFCWKNQHFCQLK